MENSNITASAIISFAEKLENDSSAFYERLAEKFSESKDTFQAFAKECRKSKTIVTRTYQETVSDALETGFSFEGLYAFETMSPEEANYADALKMAIELEEKASRFYSDVAVQTRSLLATIPRAFNKVAETRIHRKLELQLLLNKATISS